MQSAIRPLPDRLDPLLFQYWRQLQITPDRQERAEFQARRYLDILRFLQRFGSLEGKTVLDLGGGIGSLSACLHASFGGVYDVADYYVPDAQALARVPGFGIRAFTHCDLTQPPVLQEVTGGPYDLILYVEVLEHLFINPRVVFRAMRERLGRPGRLLIATPNQARLTNRLRLSVGRSIRDGDVFSAQGNADNGHVIEYTKADLAAVLRQEGFRPVAWDFRQNPPSPAGSRIRPGSRAAWRRFGGAVLNTAVFRRLEIGDEMIGLFETV